MAGVFVITTIRLRHPPLAIHIVWPHPIGHVAVWAGLVTSLLGSKRKLGFDRGRARDLNWIFTSERIPAGPRRHAQDQYFEYLDYLGIARMSAHKSAIAHAEGASG